MAEDTELNEKILEALIGLKGSVESLNAATLKNINESAKSYRQQKEDVTKSIKERLESITDALNSGTVDLKEANKERHVQYKRMVSEGVDSNTELKDTFKKLGAATGDLGLIFGVTGDGLKKTWGSLSAVGAGAVTLTKSIIDAGQMAKPLASAQAMLRAESDALSSSLKGAGSMATQVGLGLAIYGKTLPFKLAGGILALGGGLAQLAGTLLKSATDIASSIGNSIQSLEENFATASKAGALFGEGMTEIRDTAGRAGMRIGDLVEGVNGGMEAFQRVGLSFNQAAAIVGRTNKTLVQGQAAQELYALGFVDIKDRVALLASAFDQARIAGKSRTEAEKDITAATVQYAKDLKVLQAVVGKDAEQERQKARAEAMKGQALQTLKTPEQKAAFAKTYEALGAFKGPGADAIKEGFSQFRLGGVANASVASNPILMSGISQMSQLVDSGTATTENIASILDSMKKQQLADIENGGQSAMITRGAAFKAENLGGMRDVIDTITGIGDNLAGAAKDAAKTNKNITDTGGKPDPITARLGAAAQSATAAQVALEQVATSTGAVNLWATALEESTKMTYKFIESMREFIADPKKFMSSTTDKVADIAKETAILAAIAGASMLAGRGTPPVPPVPPAAPWALPREPTPTPPSGGAGGATGWISEKAAAALETMKSWFSGLEKVIPESLSSKLSSGLDIVKGFFSKLMTEVGESTVGKALASGATMIGAGFGKVSEFFSAAVSTTGKVLSKVAVAAPLLGDVYQGYQNYKESGSVGEAVATGLGSLGGRAALGAAGFATTGLGGLATQVVGSEVGAIGGAGLYRSLFGKSEKPKEEKVVSAQPNTAVGTPAPTIPVAEQLKQATTIEQQRAIIKKAEDEALANIVKLENQIASLNAQNLKKPSLEIEKALAESKEYLDKEKAKYQSLMIAKTTIANKEAIKPPVPEVPMDEKAKRYAETLKAFKERWNPSDNPQIKPVENMVGSGRGSVVEKPGERAAAQATPAPATEPSMFDKFKSLFTSEPKPAIVNSPGVRSNTPGEAPVFDPRTQAEKDKSNAAIAAGASLKGVFDDPTTAKARGVENINPNAPIDSKTQALIDNANKIIRAGTLSTPQTVTPTPQAGDIKNANPAIDLTSKVTESTLQQRQINEELKQKDVIAPAVADNPTNQGLQTLAQELSKMTYAFEEMIDYMRSIATNTKNTFHAVQ